MTSEGPGADLPVVPRPGVALSAIVVGLLGSMVTAGFAWVLVSGFELSRPERDQIPASVRAAQGSTRHSSFWFSGYHGGK